MNAADILAQARKEVEQEKFRRAVDAEKVRLLTRRTLWQRLLDRLPFTVTITRKSK